MSAVAATSTNIEWAAAQPAAHLPKGEWWTGFGDDELNRLEQKALGANPGLAAARHRVEEARALLGVSRSGYFPNASAAPSASRQRTSVNAFDRGHAAGVSHTFSTFLLPLEAGWEPDLWGRVRRTVESSKARLEATADDMEGVRLAVLAELASDYFAFRTHEAELELLRQMAAAFQRSVDLTHNRRRGGIATDLDVSRAETQLRGVEAQIPAVERRRETLLHAIAALCGENPFNFTLSSSRAASSEPQPLPRLARSELLERRPDIAAAERRVAAANAEIGVARTAFYPRIRINGLAGLQSIDGGTLFNAPSRVWAVGPALELPLFTGGRNRAQLSEAKARFETAAAGYRQIVLNAFREVADQLSGTLRLREELDAEKKAAKPRAARSKSPTTATGRDWSPTLKWPRPRPNRFPTSEPSPDSKANCASPPWT
jgi:NodT family efflux transporter outer membrane factor (OMF) lipoprotein